ncbi:glycosyltransferase [Shewanella woodyi]|uniref:Glycosyl transferase group 1 n=1 Tax=Shewanella woodyi (strain ATCC 51908 / MS32) TaxID=392500 RepID=B1KME4_SHEWM|nr:glycosyltransferase [Shewanella woodyi]ACA85942.1 glycosyl transferase group 1 [Shewanella woodyi ATCC 51908]
MKKLIYIGGFELPDKNAAAQRVIANSKIFSMLGYSLELIGVDKNLSFDDGLCSVSYSGCEFESKAVSYPKTNREWINTILGHDEIVNYLKENATDIECVILYNYPSIASFKIYSAMKQCNVTVISDITEWHSSRGAGLIFSIVKWLDTTLRIRYLAKKAGKVITTSQYMTDYYKSKNVETLELPTLYDTRKFTTPPKTLEKSSTSLIYIGNPFDVKRAAKAKGAVKERLDIVIKALSILSDNYVFTFNVYGISEEDYLTVYPEHIDLIKGLSDRVFFNGKMDHSFVIQRLQESDFSVFFRDETLVNLAGFPSKLAESVSCGIPVISSHIASLTKYQDISGVYLAQLGKEVDMIERCLKMTELELNELKEKTYNSKFFDCRMYFEQVKLFLS